MSIHHEDFRGRAVDEEGEETNAEELPTYEFPDINITLDDHHKVTKGSVEVNVKDCIECITSKANLDDVVDGKLVWKHCGLIESLASSDKTVSLFDKLDDGK